MASHPNVMGAFAASPSPAYQAKAMVETICIGQIRTKDDWQSQPSLPKLQYSSNQTRFSEPECEDKCTTTYEQQSSTRQEQQCNTVNERQCNTVQERQCNTGDSAALFNGSIFLFLCISVQVENGSVSPAKVAVCQVTFVTWWMYIVECLQNTYENYTSTQNCFYSTFELVFMFGIFYFFH